MKKDARDYFLKKLQSKPDAADRIFPAVPFDINAVKKVHFVGICGKAMASLAGLFVNAGYEVTGSDDEWNPPMSTMLEHIGIRGAQFNVYNLDGADLVIMGNAFKPSNIEAVEARARKLPQISSADAYAQFFIQDKRSIVIAGTHGKTTTTSLAVHVFLKAHKPLSALIGGVLQNTGESYVYTKNATYSIVEGDEYDTAYFDKGPKFLHYRPTIGVITSIEFDHSDIYDDIDDYVNAFIFFAAEIPSGGYLLLHDGIDTTYAEKIIAATRAKIYRYGFSETSEIRAFNIGIDTEKGGQWFDIQIEKTTYTDFFIPLFGKYNVENALSVVAIGLLEHISENSIKHALETFQGAAQRQQVLYDKNNLLIIDDFAHHPTAVKLTLEGIRDHYPDRRIMAIFEPRSNASRRKDFEIPYSESFDAADIVGLKVPPFRHNDIVDNFVDLNTVVKLIKKRGKDAYTFPDVQAIIDFILQNKKTGDVIVLMSNGHFDGLREKLINAIEN